jgi:pimeloyl-ACP methyl ester carboxylesterase
MPHVETEGGRVHYRDEGNADGPAVVMVHGSCGGSGQWGRLAKALSDRFRVVRIDLPGMGESYEMPIECVWRVEDDAAALGAVIDAVGAPVHFVGHSAGCPFTWDALAARPERIRSLTMFEPVFFRLIEDAPEFDFPRGTAEGYVARADAGDLEGALAFFTDRWAGRAGVWAAMPEPVRAMMRRGGARLRHEWASGLERAFQPKDPEVFAGELSDVPLLLVQGGATVPAAALVCDRVAALRPGAARLTVPGAGHMAPFTHADAVAEAVSAHLDAAGSRGGAP